MLVSITASAIRTCWGDGAATRDAIFAGRHGAAPLDAAWVEATGVANGYVIDGGQSDPGRAAQWLRSCLEEIAPTLPAHATIAVVIGTGLRDLGHVESESTTANLDDIDYRRVVADALPNSAPVITISNACSAGAHALAVGQDLIATGEHDIVVVAGADSMTRSMLALIGRVSATPTQRVEPFDDERLGVLLGDGAAAVVLERKGAREVPALGVLRSVGMSCDAFHPTAPDQSGIERSMRDAHARAAQPAADIDAVIAHGTGTALNDPTEAAALAEVFGQTPPTTAIKGSIGHTSGTSALHSLDLAIRCLDEGALPPVVGLTTPIDEAALADLVLDAPRDVDLRRIQIDAFGFGGVNAVTIVEAA